MVIPVPPSSQMPRGSSRLRNAGAQRDAGSLLPFCAAAHGYYRLVHRAAALSPHRSKPSLDHHHLVISYLRNLEPDPPLF